MLYKGQKLSSSGSNYTTIIPFHYMKVSKLPCGGWLDVSSVCMFFEIYEPLMFRASPVYSITIVE